MINVNLFIRSNHRLDVSMTITGEYRPPPYQDVGLIIEDSINRASKNLVNDFRSRGSRGGTQFFESVSDLAAVRVEAATPRPTEKPTEYPTKRVRAYTFIIYDCCGIVSWPSCFSLDYHTIHVTLLANTRANQEAYK